MNKISKVIIFVLLLLLGVLLIQNYLLKRNVKEVTESSNVLPPGVQHQVTVKQDHITIKEKETNPVTGETHINTQVVYVPPEGDAVITTSDSGKTSVKVHNKGFTFTPGLVVVPAKEVGIGVSSRLFFWNRAGAGVGGIITISDDPKPYIIGFADYRIYRNFAVGIAYKEGIRDRGVGATLTYYF